MFWRVLTGLGALTFLAGAGDIASSSGCDFVEFGGTRRSMTYTCLQVSTDGSVAANQMVVNFVLAAVGLLGLALWPLPKVAVTAAFRSMRSKSRPAGHIPSRGPNVITRVEPVIGDESERATNLDVTRSQQFIAEVGATAEQRWEPGRVDAFTAELQTPGSGAVEKASMQREANGLSSMDRDDSLHFAFFDEVSATMPAPRDEAEQSGSTTGDAESAQPEPVQDRRSDPHTLHRSASQGDVLDEKQEQASYCDICGAEARRVAKFCKRCGEQLPQEESQAR